ILAAEGEEALSPTVRELLEKEKFIAITIEERLSDEAIAQYVEHYSNREKKGECGALLTLIKSSEQLLEFSRYPKILEAICSLHFEGRFLMPHETLDDFILAHRVALTMAERCVGAN